MSEEMTKKEAPVGTQDRIDKSHYWVMGSLMAFVFFVVMTASFFVDAREASDEARDILTHITSMGMVMSTFSWLFFYHKKLRHIELISKLNAHSK